LAQIWLGDRPDFRGGDTSQMKGVELRFDKNNAFGIVDNIGLFVWKPDQAYSVKQNISLFEDNLDERGWQKITIERNDQIVVYLDDVEILSLDAYLDIIPEFEEFCILGTIGVKNRFDNISATADPSITSEQEETPFNFLLSGIALGALLTIASRKLEY
jgi:hypothetical protein